MSKNGNRHVVTVENKPIAVVHLEMYRIIV